ncbi:HsdS Restriction endonuclease S subunits [Flavobacteriaceae bacterium]
MKQGWEIKTFGEIAHVEYGFTDKSTEEGDYRYVRITDIDNNGELISTQKKYLKHSKEAEGFLIRDNDLLMARTGATFAKVLLYKDFEPSVFASYLIRIKFKEKIENRLYWYFAKTKSYWDQANSLASGAAQPHFNGAAVKQVIFSYPKSLSEQQRIVAILDEAFSAIAKAKANAEQNLKNAKELFESYLQGVFENKGEGWEEKLLGEVLVKTETTDPTKKPNEEFIYLDVSSVNKETKEIENATVLLGKDAPSRARKLIRTNDVIFATVRPTHSRVALITEEYDQQVCSTGYFVLRAKEFLSNNLVYYFLLTYGFNKQMEKLQKGASYPAVTDTEVKGIYIKFPKSIDQQQAIVQKLDALSAETKKLEAIYQQKINDLEELKKSVLQKAFAGELTGKEEILA